MKPVYFYRIGNGHWHETSEEGAARLKDASDRGAFSVEKVAFRVLYELDTIPAPGPETVLPTPSSHKFQVGDKVVTTDSYHIIGTIKRITPERAKVYSVECRDGKGGMFGEWELLKLAQPDPNDVIVDTYRTGHSPWLNKADSGVRITHVPTGLQAQCADDRSQHRNRAVAYDMLCALLALKAQEILGG